MIPSISVISPIYNMERLLSKCIDSILAQTFNDFELNVSTVFWLKHSMILN